MKPKTGHSTEIWAYYLLLECTHDCFIKGRYSGKNESNNMETKETEKREKHTSHLWIVIKREIIIYGLPQVGKYLILHKFPWGQRTHEIRKKWAKISFQVRSVLFSQNILISAWNFRLPDAGFLFPFIPSETLRVFLKLFPFLLETEIRDTSLKRW